MANEHVIAANFSEQAVDFTCSNTTGIEKGALLQLTDPRTASLSTATNQVLAGIAAREKIANDGRTQISVHRGGKIMQAVASGAIAVGAPVVSGLTGSLNYISTGQGQNVSGAQILGYALETASDGETIEYLLQVGG